MRQLKARIEDSDCRALSRVAVFLRFVYAGEKSGGFKRKVGFIG